MLTINLRILSAVAAAWCIACSALELPDRVSSFDYTHNFKVKNPVLLKEAMRMPGVKVLKERCSGVLNISEADMVKILPEKAA